MNIVEYLADYAMRDAISAERNRRQAADKSLTYSARLFFDGMAARSERHIIDRANAIIEKLKQ